MNWLPFLFLIFIFGGCKKSFLEVTPKGKLIAQKTSDYDLMLNSSDLASYSLNSIYSILSDELVARDPLFGAQSAKNQRLFRYEDNIYQPEESPSEIATLTKILYLYNKIINEVMDSEGGSDAIKKSIRAEALTGRAWIYLHFTNLFTKPYNPATAATDLGFPVITEADVNKSPYERGTLQATYDLMINDLSTAITDLSPTITNKFRASKPLAQAMLGKVYLAMGKYSDAIPYLDGAINNLNANTGLPTGLYNYNIELFPGGVFYSATMGISGPASVSLPANKESLLSRQDINSVSSSGNSYMVLSPEVAAKYEATDLRRKFYNNTNLPYPAGSLRKLGFFIQPAGFNVPEIYLMRAECRARTNKLYGPGNAEEDLLTFRRTRFPLGAEVIPAAMTQTQMIKFIIDERQREFAVTGLRWFDMRRLSVDPLFSGTNYIHKLYDANGLKESYPLRPERFTLKLPGRILSDNPGMQDNP